MKKEIEERVLKITEEILKSRKTVRELGKEFKISKSTVHKDLQQRLPEINKNLYEKVQEIMVEHIEIRHLRGGASTRQKYRKESGKNERRNNSLLHK